MRVVITGASSGIGEALARHYAREGAALGLISRRRLEAEGFPGVVISYAVDVTDEAALAAAAQDFIRRFGPPDLVIANAGIASGTEGTEIGDLAKLDPAGSRIVYSTFLGGDFGNLILTRGNIVRSELHDLPGIGEPRSLLEAIVDYQRRDRRFGGLKLVG